MTDDNKAETVGVAERSLEDMRIQELRRLATQKGVKPQPRKKVDLIRALRGQSVEAPAAPAKPVKSALKQRLEKQRVVNKNTGRIIDTTIEQAVRTPNDGWLVKIEFMHFNEERQVQELRIAVSPDDPVFKVVSERQRTLPVRYVRYQWRERVDGGREQVTKTDLSVPAHLAQNALINHAQGKEFSL